MISPSNSSPVLTDPTEGWRPGYFRTMHNDLMQGKFAVSFLFDVLGLRTAATIHDNSPYSSGLASAFADHFAALGGTVVFEGAVNVGDTDMRPILNAVSAYSPEALYFPIFEPEGPYIVAHAEVVPGLAGITLIASDGLLADPFPENAGENADGMYLTGPHVSGPAYEAFLLRWAAIVGGAPPSGFHANAYDATNILLDAIERAAFVALDGTLVIDRERLRTEVGATTNYPGVAGLRTRSEFGDCGTMEALGVFRITTSEIFGNKWPPDIFFTP